MHPRAFLFRTSQLSCLCPNDCDCAKLPNLFKQDLKKSLGNSKILLSISYLAVQEKLQHIILIDRFNFLHWASILVLRNFCSIIVNANALRLIFKCTFALIHFLPRRDTSTNGLLSSSLKPRSLYCQSLDFNFVIFLMEGADFYLLSVDSEILSSSTTCDEQFQIS